MINQYRPSAGRVGAFAGLWCLLAYLLGGAGILPGVLSAIAYFEGSHHVVLSESGGEFQLRLKHETGWASNPEFRSCHRHGAMARFLCTLAGPPEQTPDHVVHVLTTSLSETPSHRRVQQPPAEQRLNIAFLVQAGFDEHWTGVGRCGQVFDFAHAPPRVSDAFPCLRSVVLLI